MVEFRVKSNSKDWMESEFNPSVLELARMNDLLLALDKCMVLLKNGRMEMARPSFSIQTQVLDYFFFNLPPTVKDASVKAKAYIEILITQVENRIRNGKRNYVMERELVAKLSEFHTMLYTLKGGMNLGLRFQQKMSRNDILDSVLGISEDEDEDDEEELNDESEVIAEDKPAEPMPELKEDEIGDTEDEDAEQ